MHFIYRIGLLADQYSEEPAAYLVAFLSRLLERSNSLLPEDVVSAETICRILTCTVVDAQSFDQNEVKSFKARLKGPPVIAKKLFWDNRPRAARDRAGPAMPGKGE